jgi:DNA-binding cell septation regulator SpoVG
MEITNVSVMPLKNGKFDCLAICQFTIDNAFIITGLKLYKKNEKFYVVFPKNIHNKKAMKYCHPVSDGVYQNVLNAILTEYQSMKEANINNPENMVQEDEFYKKTFGESAFGQFGKVLEQVEDMKTAARICNHDEQQMSNLKEMFNQLDAFEEMMNKDQEAGENKYKEYLEKQRDLLNKAAQAANERMKARNNGEEKA